MIERLWRACEQAILDVPNRHLGYRSAALSFYTMMATVPLLIVLVSILSLLPLQDWIVLPGGSESLDRMVDHIIPQSTLIHDMIQLLYTVLKQQQLTYTIVSMLVAYVFSGRLFLAIYRSFRLVYNCDHASKDQRLKMVLFGVPFLLLAGIGVTIFSVVISTVFQNILQTQFLGTLLSMPILEVIMNVSNLITIFSFFLLLVLMYHFLIPAPDKRFRGSAWVAALMSLGFTILKKVMTPIFLVMATVNPIYGTFGSIFGILIWIYLSYCLLLFGVRVLYYFNQEECNA